MINRKLFQCYDMLLEYDKAQLAVLPIPDHS
jgi:hypothetical protein